MFHYIFHFVKDFFKKENANLEIIKTKKYHSILNEIKDSLTKITQQHQQQQQEPIYSQIHETINQDELYEFMKEMETKSETETL